MQLTSLLRAATLAVLSVLLLTTFQKAHAQQEEVKASFSSNSILTLLSVSESFIAKLRSNSRLRASTTRLFLNGGIGWPCLVLCIFEWTARLAVRAGREAVSVRPHEP